MGSYSDDSLQALLTAFKPRPWKQETALNIPVYSKPEPTSKTHIPLKKSFIEEEVASAIQLQPFDKNLL